MLYNFLVLVIGFIFRIIYRINVKGLENIPKSGAIICANHIHIFDPVVISMIYPEQIAWMGKKELFENPFLKFILDRVGAFPVDREVGLSALRQSMKIINQDKVLGIFPEGTRVKELDYSNAKPGVALLSIRNKAPIVPIYIDGNYRPFSKLNITIGETLEFTEAYGENLSSEDYKRYGERVLYEIYELKDQED